MSKLKFEYVPLTFINDQEEIKKQIRNTLILIHLFEKYNSPVRLEKLIEGTQYGYNASALQSGKNKFLRISDIHESKVNWETVPFCNCDDEETYLLKNEDILIARTGGTTGKSFKIDFAPAHAIYAGYLIRIRAKATVNPDYIYLFLHSFAYWSQIINLNERNFRPKANAENLKSLILPNCDKNIQDEAVLLAKGEQLKGYEELNAKIEKALAEYGKSQKIQLLLTDQLTQMENLNQAILQEAVQGKLVPQGPNDEPASELLKRIKAEKEKSGKKEKPLPPIKSEEIPFEIPESWVWCRLGEITNYGSSPKAEPSDLNNDTWVLDLEDIEKTTSKLLCRIRFNERNSLSTKSVFKTGDVLYSKLRPYLDKVIVADEDGVCTTEILPLKCYAELNPFYLRIALKRPDFVKYVNSKTKGMKMPRLGTKEGQMSLIPLAPLFEQNRIIGEVEKQFAKTKQLKETIISSQQATEQLLKALLHEAFLPAETAVQAGVVSEASEVETDKKQARVIEFTPKKCSSAEKAILAGHIINLTNNEDFGRVKFQKLLFLAEYHCNLDLASNYVQKVAGPHAGDLIKEVESTLKRFRFYEITQLNRGNHKVNYTALSAATELDSLFIQNFESEYANIDGMLAKFKNSTWEQCEIVATLYAVWNNRIIRKELITDELLKQDFLNWDKQKIKYKDRLDGALDWMRRKEIVPDGRGNYIDKPKNSKKQIC